MIQWYHDILTMNATETLLLLQLEMCKLCEVPSRLRYALCREMPRYQGGESKGLLREPTIKWGPDVASRILIERFAIIEPLCRYLRHDEYFVQECLESVGLSRLFIARQNELLDHLDPDKIHVLTKPLLVVYDLEHLRFTYTGCDKSHLLSQALQDHGDRRGLRQIPADRPPTIQIAVNVSARYDELNATWLNRFKTSYRQIENA